MCCDAGQLQNMSRNNSGNLQYHPEQRFPRNHHPRSPRCLPRKLTRRRFPPYSRTAAVVTLLVGLLMTFCQVAALRNSSWPSPTRGPLSSPAAGGAEGSTLLVVAKGDGRLPLMGWDGGVMPSEVGREAPNPPESVGDLVDAVSIGLDKDMDCCSTDLLFPPAQASHLS